MKQTALKVISIGLISAFTDLKTESIKIKLFLTGLDNQLTSWWIRHPQAISYKGDTPRTNSTCLNWLVIHCVCTTCIKTVLGAWIESQRKRSHLVRYLCGLCLAATQSTFVTPNKGESQ